MQVVLSEPQHDANEAVGRFRTNFTFAQNTELHGLLYDTEFAFVVCSHSAAFICYGLDYDTLAIDSRRLGFAASSFLSKGVFII